MPNFITFPPNPPKNPKKIKSFYIEFQIKKNFFENIFGGFGGMFNKTAGKHGYF